MILGTLLSIPAVLIAALVLWLATRPRPKHRAWGRADTSGLYVPRHGVPYEGRHEADATGPVVLGARPDGDITLVHADPPAEPAIQVRPEDEITVQVPALVGAAA